MHEVAIQADARLALEDLCTALGPAPTLSVKPDWLEDIRAVRADYNEKLATLAQQRGGDGLVMHPAALAQAIGAALPDDALAVFDGGHTTFWSNDLTPVHDVRTRFHEPGMSHLGFGLPYALALQLLHPGRLVVNITGDGSFGFTLNELDTARRANLPVVTLIHNNESWGIIRFGQKAQFDFEMGTDLAGCDYAAVARGFGCHAATIDHADEVAPALARAIASGKPAVIDCRTVFLPHPAAPYFGSMNRYGYDALAGVHHATHNPS